MANFHFKFNDTEECKLYIISDLHLNHKQEFLWGKRGYSSSEEHTNFVINKINEICRPQDILLNLGDSCLNTSYEDFESLFARIHCQQWWLKGNHNNPWEKIYRDNCQEIISDKTNISDYFKSEIIGYSPFINITIWGNYLEFVWNRQMCVFFHYPILVWNQKHHSSWCLTGHSHYSCKLSTAEDNTMKLLDCGWEGHGKPLSFSDIKKIMDKKQISQNDHHDKNTN